MRHRPLRLVATCLAGASGGRAEGREVTRGARRAQPRQHGGLVRLWGGGYRVARPAQRARCRPHREHECQHGAAIEPLAGVSWTLSTNTLVMNASVQDHTIVSVNRGWSGISEMLARLSRCMRCTCGATFGLRDHYCTEVGATRTLRSTCVIVISTVKTAGSSVDHSFICLILLSFYFVICHNNLHCTGRIIVKLSPRYRHFRSYYKLLIWDVWKWRPQTATRACWYYLCGRPETGRGRRDAALLTLRGAGNVRGRDVTHCLAHPRRHSPKGHVLYL